MVSYLSEGLPKKIRFFEDERLELLDTQALYTLLYDQLNIVVKTLIGEMPTLTDGFVLQGFDMSIVSDVGLTVQIDANLGVAVNADGRLVIKPATQTAQFTLTDGVPNYIYAYVYDAESDTDGRRRWNRSTSQEVAISDSTRFTQTIGFLNSAITRTVYNLGGQTVTLIPIRTYTPSGTVSGGTTVDNRQWFGKEATHTFPGDDSRGVTGMKQMYDAITTRIAQITGLAWEAQGANRTINAIDTEVQDARKRISTATASVDLQTSLIATRRPQLTVSTETGKGDFIASAGLKTALELASVEGILNGGEVYVKHGTYTDVPGIVIANSGLHIKGVPGKTILDLDDNTTIAFSIVSNIVVEDITFDTTGISVAAAVTVDTCSNVRFRNCTFILGSGSSSDFLVFLGACSNIRFDDCTFTSNNSTYNLIRFDSGSLQDAKFRGCRFSSKGQVLLQDADVAINSVLFEACDFTLNTPDTTDTLSLLNFSPNLVDTLVKIVNCRFNDTTSGNKFKYFISCFVTAHDAALVSGIDIDHCRFLTCRSTSAIIRFNSHNYQSRVTNCFFDSDTATRLVQWDDVGGNSVHGLIAGNHMDGNDKVNIIGVHVLQGSSSAPNAGLIITNNKIHNMDYYGIHIEGSPDNTIITKNTFRSCARAAIYINPAYSLRGLQIEGNHIQGGGTDGITIDSQPLTCGIIIEHPNLVESCIIANNTLLDFGNAYVDGSVGGILVRGELRQVLIHDNTLTNVGNNTVTSTTHRRKSFRIGLMSRSNQGQLVCVKRNLIYDNNFGAGIYFDLGDNGGTPYGCERLEICDNTITNNHSATAYATGIKVSDEYDKVTFGAASINSNIDIIIVDGNSVKTIASVDTTELYQRGGIDLVMHNAYVDANKYAFFHSITCFRRNVLEDAQTTYSAWLTPISTEAAVLAIDLIVSINATDLTITSSYESTITNKAVSGNLIF